MINCLPTQIIGVTFLVFCSFSLEHRESRWRFGIYKCAEVRVRGQLGTLLREECSKEQVGHLLPQLTFRGNASPSTGWQIEGMFNNENSKRKEEKCPAQNIFEVVSVFCVSASHPPQVTAPMALPPPDPQFVLRGTSAPVHTLHFSCGGPEPDIPLLFSG